MESLSPAPTDAERPFVKYRMVFIEALGPIDDGNIHELKAKILNMCRGFLAGDVCGADWLQNWPCSGLGAWQEDWSQ